MDMVNVDFWMLRMLSIAWRCEYVCDGQNFTVSELAALFIRVLPHYSLISRFVVCIATAVGRDVIEQLHGYWGKVIGCGLVAQLKSGDDKDVGRFGIALLRPPHCVPGRLSSIITSRCALDL